MKLKEAVQITDSNALAAFNNCQLTAQYIFRLALWKSQVDPKVGAAISARRAACEKHGKLDGDKYLVEGKGLKAFHKEMDPIFDELVDDPPRIHLKDINGELDLKNAELLLPFVIFE